MSTPSEAENTAEGDSDYRILISNVKATLSHQFATEGP